MAKVFPVTGTGENGRRMESLARRAAEGGETGDGERVPDLPRRELLQRQDHLRQGRNAGLVMHNTPARKNEGRVAIGRALSIEPAGIAVNENR